MFHPNAFASLNKPFDPRANALCAAQILNELPAGTHDWLHSIADYHSQAPMLGNDYRARVVALWHDPALSGWGLILATAYRISSQTAGITLTSPGPAKFMLRFQRPIPHRSTIDAPDATPSRRRRSDAEGPALAVIPAPRAFVARGKNRHEGPPQGRP